MNKIWLHTVFLILFIAYALEAQDITFEKLPRHLKEAGYPIVVNYDPDTYDAFDQNWGFVQDSLGILYAANGDGVLFYNGVVWKLLPLPNNGTVFSLAKAADERIYVGAHDELGYLEADEQGRMTYRSLLPYLDSTYHDFDIIWETVSTRDGVYFSARNQLMHWDGEKFKVWQSNSDQIQKTFEMDGSLYVHRMGIGLLSLKDDTLDLVAQGGYFAQEKINLMLRFDDTRLLLGTDNKLYLYDGYSLQEFKTNRPDFFEDNRLYSGIILQDSLIALGSLNKGLLIIDRQGRKRVHLVSESLLRSHQILKLFVDKTGTLWAALFSGIAKIELPSPFTLYQEEAGLKGQVLKILRFNKTIYVGTSNGLFVIDDQQPDPQVKPLQDINGVTFDMVQVQGNLLVGSNGVFEINKSGDIRKIYDKSVHCLYRSKLDSNRVFVGLAPGLISLYYADGIWKFEYSFEGTQFSVHTIVERASGELWLRTNSNNIVRVSFDNVAQAIDLKNPTIKILDSNHGFPQDIGVPFSIEDRIFFAASERVIYVFDDRTQRFHQDSVFIKNLGFENKNILINHLDQQNNVWLTTYRNEEKQEQFVALLQADGSYQIKNLKHSRVMNLRRGELFVEWSDSILWLHGKSGVIRQDLRLESHYTRPIRALITGVIFKSDSLLFGGFGRSKETTLPFANNSFRFQVGSPSFFQEGNNQFQFFLEGFDEEWSPWTVETQKDYTNIPEGNYTFKVKTRNILQQVSEEATYSFSIAPPWYRSWWAFLTYIIMAVGFLVLAVRWRSSQLRAEKEILERTVKARTDEISQKNQQLKKQTAQLAAQTAKLKEADHMKSRLFANISHEFRTPLTLIKGPIEQLETQDLAQLSPANITMIRRNTDRLLRLVNQLLDLSRLDAGSLKLDLAEGNTFKCLRAAASSFSSHAAQRNLDYQIQIPSKLLWAVFDRDKLEKVTYNLLSNAFKFTPDEGTIIIKASHSHELLQILVRDTGKGIAEEKQAHIFDRFYQVDDSHTRDHEGSGIGLALTKELVDLMQGTVEVSSNLHSGTEFRVNIPLVEIKVPPGKLTSAASMDGVATKNEPRISELVMDAHGPDTATILIVEDNADMRDYVGQQLRPVYHILEANNGQQGLEQSRELIPDLIITDLMMPQMDGSELCQRLKTDECTSHIPVIMLTAKAGLQNKLDGLEIGADDYLTKPFEGKELQVRVKNLIEQRKLLQERFSKGAFDPKHLKMPSLDQQFMQKVMLLLEERFTESDFNVPQMQESLALSKTQLHRKLKALTNQAPGEFLRTFRLKRAAQFLAQNGENVTQVAYAVGFNNLSYFAKCFKENHGQSPSEYLAAHKK